MAIDSGVQTSTPAGHILAGHSRTQLWGILLHYNQYLVYVPIDVGVLEGHDLTPSLSMV